MSTLGSHLKQAIRMLRKQPGFSATAIAVLALGIGANAAMFSLVNSFLFKPLVIAEPDRLVGLYSRNLAQPDDYRAFSYAEYRAIREHNDAFSSLLAHNLSMVGLLEGETTRRVFADTVSSNWFSGFGVPLFRGREFSAEEEQPGAGIPVTIVSYGFWKKRGGDPSILGQRLAINGRDYTVVGVAAPGFTGSTAVLSPELYLPFGVWESVINELDDGRQNLSDPGNRSLMVMGRLRDGVTLESADARLAATAAGIVELSGAGASEKWTLVARKLSRISLSTSPRSDGELGMAFTLLLFLSGSVLLIASFNVANMMLARGAARRREIAIRLALGVGRRTLLTQLFVEGFLLALLGGVGGLAVAWLGMTTLVGSMARLLPLDLAISVTPDVRVLAVTLAICLGSTLVFALVPAWRLSRPSLANDLKPGQPDTAAAGKPRRLLARGNLLVIGQLASSLVLLTVAGLFLRSSFRAASLEPGFDTANQLLVEVDPSLAGADRARGEAELRTALERLRALPGVESASLAATVPFGMTSLGRAIQRASDPPPPPDASRQVDGVAHVRFNLVDRDYFRTLGIRIERGRTFSEGESAGGQAPDAPKVVVLDRAAAEKLWPEGDAVGRTVRMLAGDAGRAPTEALVVGVVSDIQENLFGGSTEAHVFVPFGQEYQPDVSFHLRLAPQGEAARGRTVGAVHEALRAVDDRMPILRVRTLAEHLDESADVWLVRTAARMFSLFGVVAAVLAAAGLYGVRAFTVARRTRELGVRMALGSSAREALLLVLREGMQVTAVGAAIGFLLSLAIGRVLAGMLYRVSGSDPLVLVAAPLLLGAVSLFACYLPARRASQVEPMTALRAE